MDKRAFVKIDDTDVLKSINITSEQKPEIGHPVRDRWRGLLGLLLRLFKAELGLIMKVSETDISVFLASGDGEKVFEEGMTRPLGNGSYCESVLGEDRPLYIKNAFEEEIWNRNAEEGNRPVSYLGLPIKWPDGEFFGTLCVFGTGMPEFSNELNSLMLESVKSIEKDLEIASERKKLKFESYKAELFLEIPGHVILSLDSKANITFINGEGCKILGYSADELAGKNWFEMFVPESKLEKAKRVYDSIIKGEKEYLNIDYKPIKTKSGEMRIICWHNSLCKDENEKTIGTISSGRDATDEYYLKKTVDFEREMFSQIAENIGEILWIKDTETDSMIYINSLYEELWGRSKKEIYEDARSFMYNIHPEDRKKVENAYEHMKSSGSWLFDEEYRVIREDGKILWFRSKTFPVYDEKGEIYRSVGVAENITLRKEMEEKLQNLALIDDLTGIYNRRYFFSKGEEEFARSKRYAHQMSVMMLDIDHFKKVNDSFGHHYGDISLKEFSKICLSSLRKNDIFGRIGGEEFAVILPETGEESCILIAERLRKSIGGMLVETEKGEIHITTSIGIASIRKEDSGFEDIIKRADKALYVAKDMGRNRTIAGT